MRILIGLTYFRPHRSGLTIYVERLANALVSRGHHVTVLTSRYSSDLRSYEMHNGVEIIRLPVLMRISKGVIMPTMPFVAWQLIHAADVINLHVPQLDAAPLSVLSRAQGKPVVLTYHCDLKLPEGFVHSVANSVSDMANHLASKLSQVIVTNTIDYAEHSKFLQRYLNKLHVIPPPVELPPITLEERAIFRSKYQIQEGDRVIGMAARLASEKGVEYLVEAMPIVLDAFPNARVFFVGQYEDVIAEDRYADRLAPLISRLGSHWSFLGILPLPEFVAFLSESELLVVPSTNSTESFGLVQIESMTCGTPVVASDLPGVRQPVLTTGMGQIVPIANSAALAQAIIHQLNHSTEYHTSSEKIAAQYAPDTTANHYEQLFNTVLQS
jgi:glycosyltransferase involved in cell wall biosynthesis